MGPGRGSERGTLGCGQWGQGWALGPRPGWAGHPGAVGDWAACAGAELGRWPGLLSCHLGLPLLVPTTLGTSIHTSVHPSIHPSTHPPTHPSIHPFTHVLAPTHASIHEHIHVSMHAHTHRSLPPSLRSSIPPRCPCVRPCSQPPSQLGAPQPLAVLSPGPKGGHQPPQPRSLPTCLTSIPGKGHHDHLIGRQR